MNSEKYICLNDAKVEFSKIFQSLEPLNKETFCKFVINQIMQMDFQHVKDSEKCEEFNDDNEKLDDPQYKLTSIAEYLREKIPPNATLESETIICPAKGENADCSPEFTESIDNFLYDDEAADELMESGLVKKYYCADCKSKNIKPLILVSHSFGIDGLYYIFNTRLPTLQGKTILDIGSRLGAVLYGAYVYTDADNIIGVEMNDEFCKIQNDVVKKYEMSDRIKVINEKIEDCPDIVKMANVIILNNVFEFYLPIEKQVEIWKFLKSNIQSDTTLVTRPHLNKALSKINTGINFDEWVKPFDSAFESDELLFDDNHEKFSDDIGFYKVL